MPVHVKEKKPARGPSGNRNIMRGKKSSKKLPKKLYKK
jgi:hypothetical protein